MKLLTTVLLCLLVTQNITAQEILIPSDKRGISFAGGVLIDPDINTSSYSFSIKSKSNFVLGLGYAKTTGNSGDEGSIEFGSFGFGVGYIKHTDPQKTRFALTFYPSLTYSSILSGESDVSSLNLALNISKIFGREGNVYFAPRLEGGFLFTLAKDYTQGDPYWGFGFDFGLNIAQRVIWGIHISRNNIIVNTTSFGSTTLGMSFSLIFK